MKKIFTSAILLLLNANAATITFSGATRTTLANDAGVDANGLIWGVVVDTAGDGYDFTSPSSVPDFSLASDGYIGATDDYFFLGDLNTFTAAGDVGSATTVDFDPTSITGVAGTTNWAMMWNDDVTLSAGEVFGLSAITGVAAPVSNSDVVDVTEFQGISNLQTATYSVPEPTSLALLGLGSVAMITRRKR